MPTTVKVIGQTQTVESGHGKFVEETLVTAPFTTIQNRAKVSNSLKPIMGTERIMVNSINLLPNEFGPNGEKVYEPDNGDARIRFIETNGNTWFSFYDVNGMRPLSNNSTGSTMEVTFYGTGLNLLVFTAGTRDYRVTIDGGAESGDIYGTQSSALASRFYKTNTVLNAASGLSLDWHTIKIRHVGGGFDIYGVEIINEASQITVPAGTCYSEGNKLDVSTSLLEYKTGFENEADVNVGTNGGRAVIGVDGADGVVKKWLRKVNSAPAYLSSADHTNESVYRKIHWKEFGRNRGDDFSTLGGSTSDRAFTLDDGTTTLVGDNVQGGAGVEIRDIGTSYAILTFVGTGLDVVLNYDVTTVNTINVSVDGVSVGNLNSTTPVGATQDFVHKICSGLPYGTHTVKFSSPVEGFLGRTRLADFILYQPKKPTLPAGVVELGEYNLMANYVFNSGTTPESNSQGILIKDCVREVVYSGSGWSVLQNSFDVRRGGTNVETLSSGASAEYTFYGTGITYQFLSALSHTSNSTIEIDGVLVTDANFGASNIEFKGTGSSSFDGITGILNQNSGSPNGAAALSIKNLSEGEHTIKVTNNAAAVMTVVGFDIITPIHTPHTTFGSMSIRDLRKFEAEDTTNNIVKEKLTASGVIDCTGYPKRTRGISQILQVTTGYNIVYFEEVMTGPYEYTVSGLVYSPARILSIADYATVGKHRVDLSMYTASPILENNVYTLEIRGKLDKDVFDKADEE